jgi:hypothetical protein
MRTQAPQVLEGLLDGNARNDAITANFVNSFRSPQAQGGDVPPSAVSASPGMRAIAAGFKTLLNMHQAIAAEPKSA